MNTLYMCAYIPFLAEMDAKKNERSEKHVSRSMTFLYAKSSLTLMVNKFRRRMDETEKKKKKKKTDCKL